MAGSGIIPTLGCKCSEAWSLLVGCIIYAKEMKKKHRMPFYSNEQKARARNRDIPLGFYIFDYSLSKCDVEGGEGTPRSPCLLDESTSIRAPRGLAWRQDYLGNLRIAGSMSQHACSTSKSPA